MKYQVFLLPSAQRDMDSLSGKIFSKITTAIKNLAGNPRPPGSQKLTDENGYRIRIGDFRVLYRIDDKEKKIFIYRIRHRREVYR